MSVIKLGRERTYREMLTVEDAIYKRRSIRDYSGKPLSISHLSNLLYYSDGITDERGKLRAAPSAGATYPIEVYTVVNNILDLPRGIYRYIASSHELEVFKEGDFIYATSRAALNEKMIVSANCVLILSAVYQRTQRVYGDRASRYIYFEAGHVAQNIYLIATLIPHNRSSHRTICNVIRRLLWIIPRFDKSQHDRLNDRGCVENEREKHDVESNMNIYSTKD